ncbi:MAG: tetratricopeptide repeat protein [Armatimonadetes bacterium]|nr:tetratricopeptide repeat protein [Armatimonadota bacterium]
MANDTIPVAKLQEILARARRVADAHEFEALLEMLDEFMPSSEEITDNEAAAQVRSQMLVLRGKAHQILGHWARAEDDVRGVLGLATRLQDRSSLVAALLILGQLQKDRGEPQDALDTFINASKVAEAIEDRYGLAEADLSVASLGSKMGDPKEGESRMRRALQAVEGMEALPRAARILASALVQRAVEAMRKGQHDDLVSLCNRALKVMADDPLSLEAAEAYRFLGVHASMRLQQREALDNHVRALDIYKKVGFKFGQAKIYNSIGQTMLAMSRSDEAIHFMEKAEVICNEIGAHSEAATLWGKLGQVYLQREEFDKAFSYFSKDLQMSKKQGGKRALAYIHRNLGLTLGQRGEVSDAIAHFKESAQLFQQLGDELNTGRLYLDLCQLYVRQKNFERARAMAQWAQSILSKLKQTFDIAYINTLMGMIHRGEKKYPESEKYFKDAVEFFNFREPGERLVETLHEYGRLLHEMGKKDRAMERLLAALQHARALGLKQQAQRAFNMLERLDEVYLIRTFMEGQV